MSFRVLVIPKRIRRTTATFSDLWSNAQQGKPKCARHHSHRSSSDQLQEQAVEAIKGELAVRYRHFDLWLAGRDKARNVDDLEHNLERRGIRLISCAAQPEVEAWLLADIGSTLA